MRQLSSSEVLSLAAALDMETNGLAMAKASQPAVTDGELKTLVDSGIVAAEARIKGLQQFIIENGVLPEGEVR